MRNSKKEKEWGGIGHNQGPAIDQEPPPESDKLKLTSVVKSVSGGSIDHSVGADNYSADSNANAENHGARTLDGYEARRAAGFFKVAGKHVAADGLVSRRGYRRIIPASFDEDGRDGELWADNAQQLADLAKQELRGRNATVFENLVVKPLLGQKGLTVAELARRFGKDEARIYRIKYDALQRINRVSAKLKMIPEDPKLTQKEIERREQRKLQMEAADRESDRRELKAAEAEQAYFRTILKRCPAIGELFTEARSRPSTRIRTRADLIGATNVHYSRIECRHALLDRLLDRLRRLVGPAAKNSDPVLASGHALRLVASRLQDAVCGDHCPINCPCGGDKEPRLPKDLRPE